MKRSYLFSGIVIITLTVCVALAYAVSYFGIMRDYGPSIHLPFLTIDRVFTYNKSIYVHGVTGNSIGMGGDFWEDGQHIIFVSNNHGETWQVVETAPADVSDYFAKQVEQTKIVCFDEGDLNCFRIRREKGQIEAAKSSNSFFWRTVWRMPFGRKYYMERRPEISFIGVEPDTFPYDIALLENNGDRFVVAAMGNQGVLIRNQKGEWERVAVSSDIPRAAPTPYRASSFEEMIDNLYTEGWISGGFSLAFFLFLTIYAWVTIHKYAGIRLRYVAILFYLPFIAVNALGVYLIGLYNQDQIYFWMVVKGEWINYKPEYLYGLPFIGIFLTWLFFIAFTRKWAVGVLSAVMPLASSLILFAGLLLPIALWTFDIIPVYSIALLLAFVIGSIIVHKSIQFQNRFCVKITNAVSERQAINEVP